MPGTAAAPRPRQAPKPCTRIRCPSVPQADIQRPLEHVEVDLQVRRLGAGEFQELRRGDLRLAARAALGYAAEEPAFHDELSAAEYLSFVAAVRAKEPEAARERAAGLAARLELSGRMDHPVGGWSHGMRKKLSFVAAVLHQPAVLLCDEALEGFDAPSALAAKDELRALARAGAAILFSSHVTETVERLCDRVVILRAGRVVRALDRVAWGAPGESHSPLERAFLDALKEDA